MTVFIALLIIRCSDDTCNTTGSREISGRISFVSEHIDMAVEPGRQIITGYYTFRRTGNSPQRFTVSYPFPVNDDMHFPDNISVCRVSDNTRVNVNKHFDHDSVSFEVPFDKANTVTVAVRYIQRLSAHEARYILTTTAAWGKPLEHAEFVISIPDTLNHVALSYTPDLTIIDEGRIIYSMKRSQFMPEKDLVVRW